MAIYPTGTVTFLFTDIEGSTKLARENPAIWEALRLRHHAILQSAMDVYHGFVFQVVGDAFAPPSALQVRFWLPSGWCNAPARCLIFVTVPVTCSA